MVDQLPVNESLISQSSHAGADVGVGVMPKRNKSISYAASISLISAALTLKKYVVVLAVQLSAPEPPVVSSSIIKFWSPSNRERSNRKEVLTGDSSSRTS